MIGILTRAVLFGIFFGSVVSTAAEAGSVNIESLKRLVVAEFGGKSPKEWGETVTGVKTALITSERVVALTLDACGGAKGSEFDERLITFLAKEKIPAVLFVNARWIDANPDIARRLAANPLFVIANHGLKHRPASVSGRSAYGINGTKDVGELVDEIELNARKIAVLTGTRPHYYRSGTAYYDEIAVKVAMRLGHEVIGFTVLGDAGATYSKEKVREAFLTAAPGAIVIAHMNHPGSGTADGIMAAVGELRKRGYRFVSLEEYELK